MACRNKPFGLIQKNHLPAYKQHAQMRGSGEGSENGVPGVAVAKEGASPSPKRATHASFRALQSAGRSEAAVTAAQKAKPTQDGSGRTVAQIRAEQAARAEEQRLARMSSPKGKGKAASPKASTPPRHPRKYETKKKILPGKWVHPDQPVDGHDQQNTAGGGGSMMLRSALSNRFAFFREVVFSVLEKHCLTAVTSSIAFNRTFKPSEKRNICHVRLLLI
jgi:hypothetical protein